MSKTSTGPIRTFLAVEVPEPERDKLGALEPCFSELASVLKWVAPSLYHLTVRFLGAVPSGQIAAVEEAARRSASLVSPFRLHLSGLGAFPSPSSPRVIWVGLVPDRGLERLQALHERVEEALAGRGFVREDRPFSPHLTLARTKDNATPEQRRRIGELVAEVGTKRPVRGHFEVRELVVMRSDLSRQGPRYTPLASFPLGESREE